MYYDDDVLDYDLEDEDQWYKNEQDYYTGDEATEFANPGGKSALRAATKADPRIHPCPTCGQGKKLTSRDVRLGYQCDDCADMLENGF